MALYASAASAGSTLGLPSVGLADLSIRLRRGSPGLLSLPWLDPLASWPPEAAAFRELPVGPSRHTVRFVLADGVLYALKGLPSRVARKEYQLLRQPEARMLPAVQVIGLQAVTALGGGSGPIQAYCDLLEVRWLLSEGLAATLATRRPWRRSLRAGAAGAGRRNGSDGGFHRQLPAPGGTAAPERSAQRGPRSPVR